jgi:hypothetical protein
MSRKFLITQPMSLRLTPVFSRRIIISPSFEELINKSFWQFLQLPLLEQVKLTCYKILNYFKCFSLETVKIYDEIESIAIDIDRDIIQGTIRVINDYYCFTGKRPKYIFMGVATYKKMHLRMKEMVFSIPQYTLNPENYADILFMGVKIIVTPWMEGLFVWGGEE